VEQTTFSNSRLPTGPRGPFPDPSTAPSVEPVSVQGILSRPAAPLAAEPTAGRRRVRPRPTGSRTRGRGSEPEAKTEQPPTAGRGRVRSRFTGTTQRTVVATGGRLRVPTGTRIVPTGKRRRQKVKAEEDAEEEDDNDVTEDQRRPEPTAGRRKVPRLTGTAGRRAPAVTGPGTGSRGPRRRLRPLPTGLEAAVQQEPGPAIRVTTVSKVGTLCTVGKGIV
jgi:hypothetical protein